MNCALFTVVQQPNCVRLNCFELIFKDSSSHHRLGRGYVVFPDYVSDLDEFDFPKSSHNFFEFSDLKIIFRADKND